MTAGEMSLEVTLADLVTNLVVGHGGASSTLRFQETNDKPLTVMHEPDSLPAARCKACGHFVIITDPEYTDSECLVCHTVMPVGRSVCSKCGWTYRE
jgi:hypothetical protein